jgi:hypothetical protein
MKLEGKFKTRPIRFIQIIEHKDWKLKLYSISSKKESVSEKTIENALKNLDDWLSKTDSTNFENYKISTLILHEWEGGIFAIINWWIDENMLQHYVYLSTNENPCDYKLFSANGIVTCVWELAVLWHERNAWVEHVLKKDKNPDIETYLNNVLNCDV